MKDFLFGLPIKYLVIIILCLITVIVTMCKIAKKLAKKYFEFKKGEYAKLRESTSDKFEEISRKFGTIEKGVEEIKVKIDNNNVLTKKIAVGRIKDKIISLRADYREKQMRPTQEEVTELYSIWNDVEKNGNGYKEVKVMIDDLAKLM